jgi:hypothetical protein
MHPSMHPSMWVILWLTSGISLSTPPAPWPAATRTAAPPQHKRGGGGRRSQRRMHRGQGQQAATVNAIPPLLILRRRAPAPPPRVRCSAQGGDGAAAGWRGGGGEESRRGVSVEMQRGAQHQLHNHDGDLVLPRSPPPAATPQAVAEQRVVACWCWATRWWQSDHQRNRLSETKPMGLGCGVDVFCIFVARWVGV